VSPVRAEQDWLDIVRMQMLRGDFASAGGSLAQALAEHPRSTDLRRARAGIHRQFGRLDEAEALLRELLREDPADAASAFVLARILGDQGRMAAAAEVMVAGFAGEMCRDADLAINAIELLDDYGRKQAAARIADAAIAANPGDARLHAYAGMLEMQLGRFEHARRHYQTALQQSEQAWEWHAPMGLAHTRRYADEHDPDLSLFRAGLRERGGLSALARAELCFALGKADDDLGRYEHAARHFREGNRMMRGETRWSSDAWALEIADRSKDPRPGESLPPSTDFVPVFIVGMPRSGTTLLAEQVSRNPHVCNRGELPWIDRLARNPEFAARGSRSALADAARVYRMQCRQDDANDARWFVDKQPLNFRYVGLIMTLFPDARVVYCRRNPRDTALSLWTHLFADGALGFTHDFSAIARVMDDCHRLMRHACATYPSSIRTVQYERLVADPAHTIAELMAWLGPPETDSRAPGHASVVSTSSLWQVRQPIYKTSVERWRHYADCLPELLDFPEA
jgi:tetratricopeptide (TPR) repeat protein